MASWVQAIGAIFAIAASAFIVWWQVRKQHRLEVLESRRRQLMEELRVVEGFAEVAALGLERLQMAYEVIADADKAAYYESTLRPLADLDLIQSALAGARADLMTTASLSLALLSVRKQFGLALATLDTVARYGGPNVDRIRSSIRTTLSSGLLVLQQNNAQLIQRAAEIRRQTGMQLTAFHEEAVWTSAAMREVQLDPEQQA